MAKPDIWAVWPDGYMCERGQVDEMLRPPCALSDDFMWVAVSHYEEDGTPCEWDAYQPT